MKNIWFLGHGYIDITFLAKELPSGNNKLVADDYSITYGGNAVSAGFTAAKIQNTQPKHLEKIQTHLVMNMAYDELGSVLQEFVNQHKMKLHPQPVERTSPSLIFPKDGERAIIRCRDDQYLKPYPKFDTQNCFALHYDGHLPHLCVAYAKEARKHGILTSFDGGTVRENTEDLLQYTDIAVVSELFMEKCGHSKPEETIKWLKTFGVKVAAVTLGEKGIYFDEGAGVNILPSLILAPEKVVDTNGAGDVFHGAYVYSYTQWPEKSWEEHFTFARAASTHSIQFLGHIASAPTYQNIQDLL